MLFGFFLLRLFRAWLGRRTSCLVLVGVLMPMVMAVFLFIMLVIVAMTVLVAMTVTMIVIVAMAMAMVVIVIVVIALSFWHRCRRVVVATDNRHVHPSNRSHSSPPHLFRSDFEFSFKFGHTLGKTSGHVVSQMLRIARSVETGCQEHVARGSRKTVKMGVIAFRFLVGRSMTDHSRGDRSLLATSLCQWHGIIRHVEGTVGSNFFCCEVVSK